MQPTARNLDPDVAVGIFKRFQKFNKKGDCELGYGPHNHDLLRKYPISSTTMWERRTMDSKTHDVSFGHSF